MNLKELARKAVSTLFLSMLCLVAFAQTATGLVKDKTGEPMIGVNVLVKGTTNGTITDFDGKFSIPDVPSNATLVVSYIGYLTKEVKSGKDLVIVLEEDNKTLDEVVVIGYGTVKRRDLTGSVASVTGEKLAANPVANVAQALQGQLPGVSVTSQDGRPGAGMSIRIRGGGSITQSNDPLFIVDGVQVSGIDDIPADLVEEFEIEYGLPLACSVNSTRSIAERISIIKWVKSSKYGLTYYRELFEFFGIELVELNKPKPLQCTAPCTFPVNTEQLRYKLRLILRNSHTADVNCIIDAYFPAFLEINIREA